MATNSSDNLPTAAAGTILRGGGVGTASSFSTTTYPSTNTINSILYASSANVMSALASANSGVLLTSATGVPSITTAGTAATPTCVGASTAGTTIYTIQVGRSIRIGPIIIYQFNVQGTFGGTASGLVNISIPATSTATTNVVNYGTGIGQIAGSVFANGAYTIGAGGTVMGYTQSTGSPVGVTSSATFSFQGTITYFLA